MNLQRIENTREMWLNPIYAVDNRPQCKHCGEHYDSDDCIPDNEGYCSESCWHLDRLGEVKAQILYWIEHGESEKRIMQKMKLYWFYWMTYSTVNRWKRVIARKFEVINGIN
jgi:hypothetical protein